MSVFVFLDVGGFRLEGVEYWIGDYLYVDLIVFKFLVNKDEFEVEVVFKGGRNKGFWFFVVCQLLSVQKVNRSNVFVIKINV